MANIQIDDWIVGDLLPKLVLSQNMVGELLPKLVLNLNMVGELFPKLVHNQNLVVELLLMIVPNKLVEQADHTKLSIRTDLLEIAVAKTCCKQNGNTSSDCCHNYCLCER